MGGGEAEDARVRIARLGAELDSLARPEDLPGMILSGNAVRRGEYLEAANRKQSEMIDAYREHTAHLEGLVAAALEVQSELTEIVRMQSDMLPDKPGRKSGGGGAKRAAGKGRASGGGGAKRAAGKGRAAAVAGRARAAGRAKASGGGAKRAAGKGRAAAAAGRARAAGRAKASGGGAKRAAGKGRAAAAAGRTAKGRRGR